MKTTKSPLTVARLALELAKQCYLNNPEQVSEEHLLTEIRLPVDKDYLDLAGTLGAFTDVKAVKAHEAVVVTKPVGVADPAPYYKALTEWMDREGYAATEGPYERFLAGAEGGDYSKMKTEIMIPVRKRPQPAK